MYHELIPIDSKTDPKLIRKLKRHMFQEDSLMSDKLIELNEERWHMWPSAAKDGKALMLYHGNTFVGWSLIFKEDGDLTFYCWILQRHRRKGYGAQMIKLAKSLYRTDAFKVEAHDKRSAEFFLKHN